MKKFRVIEVGSSNSNKHYLLFADTDFDSSKKGSDLDVTEIKRISKRDAARPLFMLRE